MRAFLVAALVVAAAAAARATVLVPIAFRELVATAPIIVHGEVIDVRSDWSPGRRSVETFLTLRADEYLKGDLGPEITVQVPGGRLGRYRTIMIGAPVFQRGDEVVLFLRTGAPSYPSIVGLSQGAFRVVAMPGSSARLVTPPAVMGLPGMTDAQPVIRGDEARRPVAIEQFRNIVRQVLAENVR
ncbi:MAG TPA: hypothetical protein VL484_14275 [Vicinamibacterales bacterium]|jgi:hypothetical protein|nr:hypothetical protein [Vicinamibacterales bacterium]